MSDQSTPETERSDGSYTIFVVGRYHGDRFTPEQPFLDERRADREAAQMDDLTVEEVTADR